MAREIDLVLRREEDGDDRKKAQQKGKRERF
jgi:hypothetical protein